MFQLFSTIRKTIYFKIPLSLTLSSESLFCNFIPVMSMLRLNILASFYLFFGVFEIEFIFGSLSLNRFIKMFIDSYVFSRIIFMLFRWFIRSSIFSKDRSDFWNLTAYSKGSWFTCIKSIFSFPFENCFCVNSFF